MPLTEKSTGKSGDFAINEALIRQVLQKNRTTNIGQVEPGMLSGPASGSLLLAPLAGRHAIGTISVASSRKNAFRLRDERFLATLANLVAVAIENVRLFDAERARYQELQEARQRQAEAHKIAAMGDMAGNILHKVNGLVSGIRPLVQSTRKKLADGSLTTVFLSEKLTKIEESAEKTLEIAQSIHKPFEPLAPELIEVNPCLMAALQRSKVSALPLKVQVDLQKRLPPVMATPQLAEVFQNLINNAVEAMDGQGNLCIASRRVKQAVEVTVIDTGPGLQDSLTPTTIFDLGKSSKADSLGYGLWWCKIYLNRLGGSIWLDQNVASGCQFVVKLPLGDTPRSMIGGRTATKNCR